MHHARCSCKAPTEPSGSWAQGAHLPRPASTRVTHPTSGEMSPLAGEPREGAGTGHGSARMLCVHEQEDLERQGGRTSGAELEDRAWAEAG